MRDSGERVFIKLGGSLITDKRRERRARLRVIRRLAKEIREALTERPELRILVGHGSGSFGHAAAARTRIHEGISRPEDWWGFAEVALAAAELHMQVRRAFHEAGLPTLSIPPSAVAEAAGGRPVAFEARAFQRAWEVGLIPLTGGDVVFDRERGAAILSTEQVFDALLESLRPTRILLVGDVAGVLADGPDGHQVIPHLTPERFREIQSAVGASRGIDVTGGMRAKLEMALRWVERDPDLDVWIFSGRRPGALRDALRDPPRIRGTRITGM
ncbi:isopentenyl phosphate kinase [Thermoflexus sp.]|uniref:isopentenyl phosphate kinase n=1 Tax=Thermoflexus sp. TaxID=1969742 RepID=UPI002ADDF386|nr:isopentenyl phosphate kinase [Thermoflexus sp.]